MLTLALASGCSARPDDDISIDAPSQSGGAGSGGDATGGKSSESGGRNSGGSDTGGSNTGGSNTGGSNTGGNDTGGANTGGGDTGGSNTGGSGGGETGGSNTGGGDTGGTSSGGAGTGGDATGGGGSDPGGSNTGGSNTGGDDTGGTSSGGSNTGGGDTGGSNTGGSGGGGDTGGTNTGGSATGGSDTGGTSSGGSDTGGTGGTGSVCDEGTTRPGAEPCGLNLRGTFDEKCQNDAWVTSSKCSDPDDCVDGESTRLMDVCGRNGRGDIGQSCVHGKWSSGTCNDPDQCDDNAQQTLTDVCGRNNRGDITQTCVHGAWKGNTCVDPDECNDGTQQMVTDVCGLNDRGDIAQSCVNGAWTGSTCLDPDECEDGDFDLTACANGSGTLQRECVTGAWTDGACSLDMTYRASVDSAGAEASNNSDDPHQSADGRYVVFVSSATNLVSDDTNGKYDVFVHDLVTGETTRVSVSSDGSEGNGTSYRPSISADGRYVAFVSSATNLVPDDSNATVDAFVHDLVTGETTRVSVSSAGEQANGQSSGFPYISADGRYVVFGSLAPDLVAGDTNGTYDVFLHDRTTGETTRVSESSAGEQGDGSSSRGVISGNNRFVAFESSAGNLVMGDTNSVLDVFVRDLTDGSVRRVSVSSSGGEADAQSFDASISDDGRYVVFTSNATNLSASDTNGSLADVYLHDTWEGSTDLLSTSSAASSGNADSQRASISADGQTVVFTSDASDLTAGDTNGVADIFVVDLATGVMTLQSSTDAGAPANGKAVYGRLSGDGSTLVFSSWASNLVANDTTNTWADVFVRPVK